MSMVKAQGSNLKQWIRPVLALLLAAGAVSCVATFLRPADPDVENGGSSHGPSGRELSRAIGGSGGEPVAPAPFHFEDRAAAAGLNYRWKPMGKRPLTILGTVGNGCAFLDYDNDGNLDILLVGPKLALYRGDGKGHFSEVTAQAGLDRLSGDFRGVAVGDIDNDGFDDLYISGYRTGVLLHNEGGKRFADVTTAMGLPAQPWGASVSFADLDGDGFLDLFICNYVDFGPGSVQTCPRDGIVTACDPQHYPRLRGVAYKNLAGKAFADRTDAWGLNKQTGNALGVACADFDGSGRPGIAVANDEPGDDLFRPDSKGVWDNISLAAGTRGDRNGNFHAGMGVDWGDYDNDGKPDLFVTTFEREAKCLYHNEGSATFVESSAATGIEPVMIAYVSFGCKFLDADNDGWLDILVASGHVEDNVDSAHRGISYRQPLKLLYNSGLKTPGAITFRHIRRGSGLDDIPPLVGRGVAIGDYDNDGRMDALVVDGEGAPVLLHNETSASSGGHFLGLTLAGNGKSNRDGYGARVTLTLSDSRGERTLTRFCHADGSYLSSSDKRVHFGLGNDPALEIKQVIVRWPDGRIETRTGFKPDAYTACQESR